MSVLVTGATGFVGANVVRHLAQHGHRVIACDVTPPIPIVERFWQPVQEQIDFEIGDVTDAQRLSVIADYHEPTAIVHAAAITAVDAEREAQLASRMVETNVMGTVRLLDVARRPHVRRMLYVSSSGVYGSTDPAKGVSETTPLPFRDFGLYAISKEVSERLCIHYGALYGFDVVIGRLGGPYGPMERDTGVRTAMSPIYQLARAALRQDRVRLRTADFSYTWTYTSDLALAIRLLLEAEAPRHQIYNLSSGQYRPLSDVTAQLSRLIPDVHFEWVREDEPADVAFSDPPHRGPLDITRLREDVGYEPAYDLEGGLRAALPWWRQMLKAC